MFRSCLNVICLLFCCILFGCNETAEPTAIPPGQQSVQRDSLPPSVSEDRSIVAKEAVARYEEKVDNPLNEWYFRVQLFETPSTFKYRMKLQYEEIRGEDTLKLPNFGTMPKPEIRKGPTPYSCIIGFLDKNAVFREYKKVYVVNGALKVTTLKQYGVSTIRKELR